MLSCIKNGHKNITFGYVEIKKHKCHNRKNQILLQDVDVEKIQVSTIVPSGAKKL